MHAWIFLCYCALPARTTAHTMLHDAFASKRIFQPRILIETAHGCGAWRAGAQAGARGNLELFARLCYKDVLDHDHWVRVNMPENACDQCDGFAYLDSFWKSTLSEQMLRQILCTAS